MTTDNVFPSNPQAVNIVIFSRIEQDLLPFLERVPKRVIGFKQHSQNSKSKFQHVSFSLFTKEMSSRFVDIWCLLPWTCVIWVSHLMITDELSWTQTKFEAKMSRLQQLHSMTFVSILWKHCYISVSTKMQLTASTIMAHLMAFARVIYLLAVMITLACLVLSPLRATVDLLLKSLLLA